MKKLLSILLIVCFAFSLSACGSGNDVSSPSDAAAAGSETVSDTASATPESEPDAENTSSPAECDHTYSDATCTAAKTCTKCGVTDGGALGHSYAEGKCTRCSAADPDYVKKYDVYINDVGFDLNSTVTVEIFLKTKDTTVVVCPCVKLYKRSGSEWVPYEGLYSFGDYFSLESTSGGPVDTNSDPYIMYGRWDWMSNEVDFEDSEIKVETDFSAGRMIRRMTQVFSEAGEYKIELTDGSFPEQNNNKYTDSLSLKIY